MLLWMVYILWDPIKSIEIENIHWITDEDAVAVWKHIFFFAKGRNTLLIEVRPRTPSPKETSPNKNSPPKRNERANTRRPIPE